MADRRPSPTPRGVGGLKSAKSLADYLGCPSPTPRGVGGLKLRSVVDEVVCLRWSHPAWGGWIEIALPFSAAPAAGVPPRVGWVD